MCPLSLSPHTTTHTTTTAKTTQPMQPTQQTQPTQPHATGGRYDLASVDLLGLIGRDTTLRRVAGTNGGEYAGPCPSCGGCDRLRVQPDAGGKGRWFCRQCTGDPQAGGHWLDAIDYMRQRDGVGYREACAMLAVETRQHRESTGFPSDPQDRRSQATSPAPAVPTDAQAPAFDQAAALAVIEERAAALWSSAGAKARRWLAGRGIQEDTARAWRLGYNPARRELHGLAIPRGIVIPCFVGSSVQYVKVRRPVPPLPGPKYQQVKGSRSALFGLNHLAGRRVAVICEGELDAALLWQEAGDLVDVVALGSKDARPALPWLAYLAGASRWLVALDRDADDVATWWGDFSSRVRRVRSLQGNDLTDFYRAGGDLRAWVSYHIERFSGGVGTTPPARGVLEIKADMEKLLDEMAGVTGSGDEIAERLLTLWKELNREYDAAVWAAPGVAQGVEPLTKRAISVNGFKGF
jgi:DNA primase